MQALNSDKLFIISLISPLICSNFPLISSKFLFISTKSHLKLLKLPTILIDRFDTSDGYWVITVHKTHKIAKEIVVYISGNSIRIRNEEMPLYCIHFSEGIISVWLTLVLQFFWAWINKINSTPKKSAITEKERINKSEINRQPNKHQPRLL